MPKPNPLADALKKSIGGDQQLTPQQTTETKAAPSKAVQASRQKACYAQASNGALPQVEKL